AYLARVFGRPASAWQVMRQMHCFAATILDRVFLLSDRFRQFDVRVHGLDALTARMRPDRGVLLFGAHIGSFEVLRVLAADAPDVRVCPMLDPHQTPALTDLLHALDPDLARDVIDASRPGSEIVLALREAIDAGALAALLADRARPREATIAVDFLDAPAHFPVAPFQIASALKAPVVLCFGLYLGGNRYDLYFEAFADELTLPRRAGQDELRAAVQRYAERLEHHVRAAPYNWFNFYDFWNLHAPATGGVVAVPARGGG
ncbi:MAG: acyltransferase, partial [Candidatus Dormibacteria bacterium]